MLGARRLEAVDQAFGLYAAGRLLTKVLAPWVQDLGLLVELVEADRPPGAGADWQPGAVLRLPFSPKIRRDDGLACGQALAALADAAMVIACAAAWGRYRPMALIDQTMHVVRPVTFDVIADARVVRTGGTTSFGRVMLYSCADKRPVAMMASAYATV
jgi:acyl-coenzyme A thioesterase PaaI-like protein